MFKSFLSYDSKQDYATTIEHSKHIIKLLKQQKNMPEKLSKIWGNTDGCAEYYICATALYLM